MRNNPIAAHFHIVNGACRDNFPSAQNGWVEWWLKIRLQLGQIGGELAVVGGQVMAQGGLQIVRDFALSNGTQSAESFVKVIIGLEVTLCGIEPVLFGQQAEIRNARGGVRGQAGFQQFHAIYPLLGGSEGWIAAT